MNEPQPFDPDRIGRDLAAGHTVRLGSVLVWADALTVGMRCEVCGLGDRFGIGWDQALTDYLNRHNHGVS